MRNPLLLGLVAALSLSACATTGTPAPQAAVQPEPAWSKDYFKVGARLFPRCQNFQPTGSRVNDSTWCLTEEQIAQIDGSHDQARVDFQQRSSQLPISISR